MSERGARGLILLRTHFVDDRIAALARAYAAGGDYDVMIAVDETVAAVDSQGLPKLSMTLDSCVRLGLNVAFETPLWRCGDYVFYHAHAERPGYRRYWSIEYDIALNFADPLDFFRRFDREAEEDYLTTFLEVAPPKWHWRKQAELRFPVVYASGFALVRLTGAAIVQLLERRRLEGAWLKSSRRSAAKYWLNDEAFVSSAAPQLGLSMADLNKYGDFYTPQTLMRGGVWHPRQVPPADGKIYHAVRTGPSFLAAVNSYYTFALDDFFAWAEADQPEFAAAAARLLSKRLRAVPDDPAAVFGAGGALAEVLPHLGDARVVGAVLRALAERRMRLCLEALQRGRVATPAASAPALGNVALGREAWQSSTSPRSAKRNARRDAEGGNDGNWEIEYGFHTAQQDHPWWAVDLGGAYALRRVRLFNRPGAEHRLRHFVIETSSDFIDWTTIYAHDPADVRLLRARPIDIALPSPVSARYLRVRLPRKGVLHLAEVEVYKD